MVARHALYVLAVLLTLGATARSASAEGPSGSEVPPEVEIAVIATVYRPGSHADAIAGKFIDGFPLEDGTLAAPRVRVVSLWLDQPADSELGLAIAEEHGITVYPTVTEALTRGGQDLAVDGVLFIGEHGDYPRSQLGVKMYPRLRILEQVFDVFDASGQSVPVFVDKQLSHSWHSAAWIAARAAELDVPMMAGSALPVARRVPALEHPAGEAITEAVAVGYGPIDSYGFHILEILQSMLERRAGGETGVASVEALRGREVYERAEQGLFSTDLVEAAIRDLPQAKPGRLQDNEPDPIAIVVTYRDGTKGVALSIGRHIGSSWGYAARLDDGRVVRSEFQLDQKSEEHLHFSYLGLNVQEMFLTRQPQAPVQRTLLTSGLIEAALQSLRDAAKHPTPHLDVRYQPLDIAPIRMPGTVQPAQ